MIIKNFMLTIGYGYLTTSSCGKIVTDAVNMFLPPDEILSMIPNISDQEYYDPDPVDDDELPFFAIEPNLFLVLKKANGEKVQVCSSGGYGILADSFNEFIYKLVKDPEFYFE